MVDGCGCLTTNQTAMDPGDSAMTPDRQMQVGDVAEPNQWFGVGADSVEVETIEEAISPSPGSDRDDCSDLGVGVGGVEVSESILVASGHVTSPVQGVLADLDLQAPTAQDLCVVIDRGRFGEAAWRD